MQPITTMKWACALIAAIFFFTTDAEAARRTFNLSYGGQDVMNNQALFIKRDLERMYGVDTRDLELVSVTAQVKSIDHTGSVQLRTGRGSSEVRSISTRPGDWWNPSDWSYDHVQLRSYGGDSWGEWTLNFYGNRMRVNRVTVEVETWNYPKPSPGPNPRPRPRPGQRYAEVICATLPSRGSNQCPVGFRVTEVVLLQQFAGPCIPNRSFFAGDFSVEVYHGCSGRFGVYGY